MSGLSYEFHAVATPCLLSQVRAPIWQFGLAESAFTTLVSLALIRTLRVEAKRLALASAAALLTSRLLLDLFTSPLQAPTGYVTAYVVSSLYSPVTAILESVLITVAAPLAGFIADKCRRRYAVLIANDV